MQDELREEIIKLSLLQHKKKYEHGKMGPDTFDCAGFVWFIYNSLFDLDIFGNGYGLSTTTKMMTNDCGKAINFKENLKKDLNLIKKGDILFFHRQSLEDKEPTINNYYPGHCGIYLGDKKFIHCPKTKGRVIISNFDNNAYWLNVLVGSKDLISDKTLSSNIKK